MPRSLVFGNSHMLATFDETLQMRDLYYPYVGMEDQTTYGHMHRIGVLVEGRGFSWLGDGSWRVTPSYTPETLVGNSTLRNDRLGLVITAFDYVHPVHNILLRHFRMRSTDGARHVRMFFNHNFYIYGDKQKDTAFYEPYTNCIIHYRQSRYFLVGGTTDRPTECVTGVDGGRYESVLRSMQHLKTCGISSFNVGKADYRGLEGTWKDAEDGELNRNPIEQGSVDSTVGIHCAVGADKETEVVLWLCLGKTLNDVLRLQQIVLDDTPERLLRHCHNYWKSWVNKTQWNFGSLSPQLIELFKRSLLLIRTHIDKNGGVIAAADSDIMAFNRDTYTYVWPRDGAFVSLALDQAGYQEVTREFFRFCCRIQSPDGYLLHKYNPDGSLGSSWHPWFRSGEAQLPIQEDETALVIHALWKHFQSTNDFEFLQEMYENFVRKGSNFLCDFREEKTGLPLPSYDPWEEHRGIFTYTTAATIAGLHASARICHILGHHQHSEIYEAAADQMRQALLFHLFDEGTQRFLKKIKRKDGQTTERDLTPDASIAMIWILGVLPVDDPRVLSTMRQLTEQLSLKTGIKGFARYPGDHYQEVVPIGGDIPGNPWIITTLWFAQWQIATAKISGDLAGAKGILEWVLRCASPSGILPEQMHPLTGAPLSVAPLTWSHSTFVETVIQYLNKERSLLGQEIYAKMGGG
ncbi:glycoside hydrolase family 15 protein [Candidatus Peregrinibacteria bacterium]|nr:glycoside hydrolase family 15 protein [Candidatus Peregrinibacteria bacterium]MBI3816852.1 glycoside hydrolase family 15 protein [Candidatus Peregrinibacteria bacterium]